eukprot:scaffold2119_cov264-Pinguiococcus_pyrenoidosus.AAC.6
MSRKRACGAFLLLLLADCCGTADCLSWKRGPQGSVGVSRSDLLRALPLALLPALKLEAWADQTLEYMPALSGKDYGKQRTVYPDFKLLDSGLQRKNDDPQPPDTKLYKQVKDVKPGEGDKPRPGDRVVIDWSGYTIGYYGRIFEASGKVQGGAFANEKSLYRFVLGSNAVIAGLDQAVSDMRVGGVRQIVIPPELGCE